MAAADYASVVQQLYVSYFGRPADFYGLASFEQQLAALKAPTNFIALNGAAQNGSNPGLTALVNSFSGSPESIALYGSGTDTIAISKFVSAVYNNVLNRDPDVDGLAYWVKAITSGALTKANAAAAITEGALSNTSAQGLIDAKTVTQKALVAADFTGSLSTASDINAFSGDNAAALVRTMLHTVANDTDAKAFHATVLSTIAELRTAPGPLPGPQIALTVDQDNLTGNAGNNVFSAGAAQNAAGKLIDTLQNVDYIDGGAGADVLKVTESEGQTIAATLKNVEAVEARFTAAGNISLINTTGVTSATVTGSTVAGIISSVGDVANLGVTGQNVNATFKGNTAALVNLSLDTFGKSAAVKSTVTLDTGISTLNVSSTQSHAIIGTGAASIKSLSVVASGVNDLDLTGSVSTLKTVIASGAGALDLSAAVLTGVTKLDASANAGGVTARLSAIALAVNGGAGNDVISYAPGTAIAAQSKIALGAGDDTLILSGITEAGATVAGGDGNDTLLVKGAYLDANAKTIYSGFEVLEVANNSGALVSIDTAMLAGVGTYAMDLSADKIELTNLANNASATVKGSLAGGLTMGLKTVSGGTDGIAIVLDNGKTAANVTTNDAGVAIAGLKAVGVETITLHSNGAVGATAPNGNVVTNDVANTALSKVIMDGSAAGKFTTGAITKALTVDASAATGVVTVDGSAATVQLNINGGSAGDVLKGGVAGGAICGGAGGDAINIAAGAATVDTMTYKGASDSLFAVTAAGALDTGRTDVVTGFHSGQDKLDLTKLAFSVTTDKVVVQKTAADLAALSTLAATAAFYNDSGAVARGVVAVTVGSDVFVIADANHDHKFSAATDLVIKLSGTALAQGDVIFG